VVAAGAAGASVAGAAGGAAGAYVAGAVGVAQAAKMNPAIIKTLIMGNNFFCISISPLEITELLTQCNCDEGQPFIVVITSFGPHSIEKKYWTCSHWNKRIQ